VQAITTSIATSAPYNIHNGQLLANDQLPVRHAHKG
jgi:hypothetical protein